MTRVFFASLLAAVLFPLTAHAVAQCSGTLTKDHFVNERKQMQKDLQASIIKYRKLEASSGSPSELKAVKAVIDVQKTKFQEFESKYFPMTSVTAYGAACNDLRWIETAKAKLVEHPEHLGKKWFVWLDKTTRKMSAGHEKPPADKIAE